MTLEKVFFRVFRIFMMLVVAMPAIGYYLPGIPFSVWNPIRFYTSIGIIAFIEMCIIWTEVIMIIKKESN